MNQVIACDAAEGSDEHFIATELFAKKEQREMFLHMSEVARFDWLHRKFNIKHDRQWLLLELWWLCNFSLNTTCDVILFMR